MTATRRVGPTSLCLTVLAALTLPACTGRHHTATLATALVNSRRDTRPSPPPPPPPQAAADCIPGPFIVFFAWDSVDLTSEATPILDNAIARYVDCGRVRATIAGFADRSGRRPYNLPLSARRAEAVKAYFAAHGVDPSMMTIKPFGEDPAHLYFQTADGVQQVRNRRVEITYSAD